MTTAMLVIGIVLLVFAVFLIVAVLMQQGKAHNLSGTIAGGAETFFGKSKGQTMNKKLSILTTVVAIVFSLLVCSVYIMQDGGKDLEDYGNIWGLLNPFNNPEIEEVEHDHNNDGVSDHTDEDHVDEENKGADSDKAPADSDKAPADSDDIAAGNGAAESGDNGAAESGSADSEASSDSVAE